MIKNFFWLSIAFMCCAQHAPAQAPKKDISVEAVWGEYAFWSRYVPGFNFMKNGTHYSKLKSPIEITEYNLGTGKETYTIFAAPDDFYVSSYSFSEDEEWMLLETEAEKIYRYSSRANFYVYERSTKKLEPLSKNGKQRYASFDAEAEKVAFVRDNNIFYKDLASGEEKQITTDGAVNKIINGATDWVYEEEFAIDQAFEWSPDGEKIAYLKFDEQKVPEFTMFYYNDDLYPEAYTFKYPKAGEKNSIVTAHIYDLASGKTIDIDTDKYDEQYLPRIQWTPSGDLCITRMNRHQNELDLLLVNPKNGKVSKLLSEKNDYFINIEDNLTFVGKDKFLWSSDMDGYHHLYLYNMKGKLISQLTKGQFDVTQLYGIDEEKKIVYFQAAAKSPTEREVYMVSLEDGEMKELSTQKGVNDAQFSSTFQYYILNYSNVSTPSVHTVFETAMNKEIRVVEDNADLVKKLDEYNLGSHEFFQYKTKDGVDLNGWMIKPADFDENKQYPVLMFMYGGPGHQTVMNEWSNGNLMWFHYLAQEGYIVVSVDNRGTDAAGEAFRKSTYQQLGKYESQDQIEVATYLANRPYVDAGRIGAFGWSFGGYLSTLCLAKGSDVFKMAIAVAPVINWKWYDTIYTERFMRTPGENNDGYEDNSPINHADKIKGAYLLVHGMADDNVHFQHSAEMSRALIEKNIPFEQAFYTNKNHGIYGGQTRLHLYTKMTNYIKANL